MAAFVDQALEILGSAGRNRENLTTFYEQRSNIVPFVGAGLSIPFGYPSWAALLRQLCPDSEVRTKVDSLLDYARYEEAAYEVKQHLAPVTFRRELASAFDEKRLLGTLSGASTILPMITPGLVLTTNLDRVLEHSFRQCGRPFENVYRPDDLRDASRAIQTNELALIKLHGDYSDRNPVLTVEDYDRAYGGWDDVDMTLPLPRLLSQALGGRCLFFLGCSLQTDRTLRVVTKVVEKMGIEHFALVSDQEATSRRREEFARRNIRPIYYPSNEYARIPLFLELIASLQDRVSRVLPSMRPVNLASGSDPSLPVDLAGSGINEIVARLRKTSAPGVSAVCGKIRVLSMSQSIDLASVYSEVAVFGRRSAHRQLNDVEIRKNATIPELPSDKIALSARRATERLSGKSALSRHRRLWIHGKPGAGKSTFLKHLAVECVAGSHNADLVPLYFKLRHLSQGPTPSTDFLVQAAADSWMSSTDEAQQVFRAGRGLILLDGLDEVVNLETRDLTIRLIDKFASQYPLCQVVVTCRNGATEWTSSLFTDVEMADFDESQITGFVRGWLKDERDAKGLLTRLRDNTRLHELATSPLLLAMLCIVWEDRGDFEGNRARLYEQAFDVLLTKWDSRRRISRETVYRRLNKDRVQALLADIAFKRFLADQYFFPLSSLNPDITGYFLEHDILEDEAELSCEMVMRSIEENYGLMTEQADGVWSFSHLTFQEFLVAWRLSQNEDLLRMHLHTIADERWREVWLLLCGMKDVNYLLTTMLAEANRLVESDTKIQECLHSVVLKGRSHSKPEECYRIRGYYVALATDIVLDGKRYEAYLRKWNLENSTAHDLKLDLALGRILALFRNDNTAPTGIGHDVPRTRVAMARELFKKQAIPTAQKVDPRLVQTLEAYCGRLPKDGDRQWWARTRENWVAEFRSACGRYRAVGFDWGLRPAQRRRLKEYVVANKLLEDCLQESKTVKRNVRLSIKLGMYSPRDS